MACHAPFFFQAEDGIRDHCVTGVQTCALPISIQLGIDNRVGTIDVGKDADLAIYNHDPLSAYAVVQKTLIDGRVYFDRDKDLASRAEIEKEKKTLTDKLKKEEKKPEEKKPEEKKPEQSPKPPALSAAPTAQARAVQGGAL